MFHPQSFERPNLKSRFETVCSGSPLVVPGPAACKVKDEWNDSRRRAIAFGAGRNA
jgi:hypothetical protein